MAIKTFTTAEVLTSADTNTYLANSGLVFVKQQTIGTAVTSVLVDNAFNATYDAYEVIVSGGTSSGNFVVRCHLGSATPANGYYYAGAYVTFGGTIFASNGNNAAFWLVSANNTDAMGLNIFFNQPFLAKRTAYRSNYYSYSAGDGAIALQGYLNDSVSYTDFRLTLSAGTLTGGTVTVYGYRKA